MQSVVKDSFPGGAGSIHAGTDILSGPGSSSDLPPGCALRLCMHPIDWRAAAAAWQSF